MKRFLLIAIGGAIFGAVTAYFSAQIFNGIHVDCDKPQNHWFDSFMILLAPGGFIDRLIYGNAGGFNLPYEDRIEGDELAKAALFKAVGWMFIAPVVECLFWSITWARRAIFAALYCHAR